MLQFVLQYCLYSSYIIFVSLQKAHLLNFAKQNEKLKVILRAVDKNCFDIFTDMFCLYFHNMISYEATY